MFLCYLIFLESTVEQQECKCTIAHGKFTSSEENPQKRKKKMFDEFYANKGWNFSVLIIIVSQWIRCWNENTVGNNKKSNRKASFSGASNKSSK